MAVFMVSQSGTFAQADRASARIKRLISQLEDKKRRLDAQRQLSSYGEEVVQHVVPVLRSTFDPVVRTAALRIIAKVGDSSVEDDIVVFLKDSNHKVRQEAARTLGVIGKKDTTIDALKAALNDHFPNVRYHIIRALSQMPRASETEIFVGSLGDYDPRIRKFAVVALGDLKSVEAIPYLSQMVGDIDPGVRVELVNTFEKIASPECLQPLVWLMGDFEPNIRVQAVEAIGKVKSDKTEDALVEAASSMDPRIASTAITELTARKSSRALEIAKAHIDDEHMSVKVAAIESIGKMGGNDDKPLLTKLLSAESTTVRKKAGEALAFIGSGA